MAPKTQSQSSRLKTSELSTWKTFQNTGGVKHRITKETLKFSYNLWICMCLEISSAAIPSDHIRRPKQCFSYTQSRSSVLPILQWCTATTPSSDINMGVFHIKSRKSIPPLLEWLTDALKSQVFGHVPSADRTLHLSGHRVLKFWSNWTLNLNLCFNIFPSSPYYPWERNGKIFSMKMDGTFSPVSNNWNGTISILSWNWMPTFSECGHSITTKSALLLSFLLQIYTFSIASFDKRAETINPSLEINRKHSQKLAKKLQDQLFLALNAETGRFYNGFFKSQSYTELQIIYACYPKYFNVFTKWMPRKNSLTVECQNYALMIANFDIGQKQKCWMVNPVAYTSCRLAFNLENIHVGDLNEVIKSVQR